MVKLRLLETTKAGVLLLPFGTCLGLSGPVGAGRSDGQVVGHHEDP